MARDCCASLASGLNRRVVIQEVTQVSDGQGGFEDEWNDVATVWASIEPLKAYERFQAMQMQTPVTHKLVIRYHAAVSATCRIRHGDRAFWVKEIINVEERNRFLVIKAIERVQPSAPLNSGRITAFGNVRVTAGGNIRVIAGA